MSKLVMASTSFLNALGRCRPSLCFVFARRLPSSTFLFRLSLCLRDMSCALRAFAKFTNFCPPFLPAAPGLSNRSYDYELVYEPAAVKSFDATLPLDEAGDRCWTCIDLPLETPGTKSWAYTPPVRMAIRGLNMESRRLPCHHPTS
jgi:hypothetical protein